MNSPTEKMGFPEGIAEKLVLQSFHKYDAMAQKRIQMNKKMLESKACQYVERARTDSVECVPQGSSSTTVKPTGTVSEKETPDERIKTTEAEPPQEKSDHHEQSAISSPDNVKQSKTRQDPKSSTSTDQDQAKFQDNPDSYNGAIREKYSWSQSITDVDVKIWVPDYIRKGKQVQVNIQRKHLCVKYSTQSGDTCVVVDGDLMWDVHKDECMWSLEPGKCVVVNLGKVQERWWEAVLGDEPKINVQKIDPSRPITDLDDEAQAKIEEMMYNERQKKLGLPQSHEQKVHNMLKTAWDADGSPFKGQPFDPSKLNITQNMS